VDFVCPQIISLDLIEEAQIIHAIIHFLYPHLVLLQGVAHEDLIMRHSDRSCAARPPHQEVFEVFMGFDLLRHFPARWLVDHPTRPLHPKCLLRAILIEFIPKLIELALLSSQTTPRRDRCFLLQRAMHTLVHTILLRFPGINQLRVDPKLDEPHRGLRQPRQGVRDKRDSVVRPYALGSAQVSKR
jgi:hypothetical protein